MIETSSVQVYDICLFSPPDVFTATPIPTLSRKTPRHISNKNYTYQTPNRDPTTKPPVVSFDKGEGKNVYYIKVALSLPSN